MRHNDDEGSSSSGGAPSLAAQQRHRCNTSLRAFQPRICRINAARGDSVFVAGAAQTMFNASGYFGSARRAAASLSGVAPTQHTLAWEVQAHAAHAILSRNEHGSGYYHVLFDTLASLSFLWPAIRNDPTARIVLNSCTTHERVTQAVQREAARSNAAHRPSDLPSSLARAREWLRESRHHQPLRIHTNPDRWRTQRTRA